MPIYEFDCEKCGNETDEFRKFGDIEPPTCDCGAKMRKIISSSKVGAVVGSGDTTNVLMNRDGTPYRFKSGTVEGQRLEIKNELRRQQREKVKSGELREGAETSFDVY